MIILGHPETLVGLLGDQMPDLIVIDVNLVRASTDKRSDRKGLDVAAEYAKTGQPVILTSFESEEDLKRDPRFATLLYNHPNVGFLRLPVATVVYSCQYYALKHYYESMKDLLPDT